MYAENISMLDIVELDRQKRAICIWHTCWPLWTEVYTTVQHILCHMYMCTCKIVNVC